MTLCIIIAVVKDIAITGATIGPKDPTQTKYGFVILTDTALKIVIMYSIYTNEVKDVYEIPYTSIKNVRKVCLPNLNTAFALELDQSFRAWKKHTLTVEFHSTSPGNLPYQGQNIEIITNVLFALSPAEYHNMR